MITTRDKILSAVTKPTRYTGGELNSVIKDGSASFVRFGFCFADIYEIAMSHLGLKILYHTLNERSDTYCERVFAPWTDMEDEMKKHGMRLFALESGDEVTHFDMLGFTLQYELCYSTIVNMLNLAEIPVLAKDRDETYPIICGGGHKAMAGGFAEEEKVLEKSIDFKQVIQNLFLDAISKKKAK